LLLSKINAAPLADGNVRMFLDIGDAAPACDYLQLLEREADGKDRGGCSGKHSRCDLEAGANRHADSFR
jgi:hypothetical protein